MRGHTEKAIRRQKQRSEGCIYKLRVPENARNHQKLGERPRTESSSQPSEGTNPVDTLIVDSGLQNWERTHISVVWAAQSVVGSYTSPSRVTHYPLALLSDAWSALPALVKEPFGVYLQLYAFSPKYWSQYNYLIIQLLHFVCVCAVIGFICSTWVSCIQGIEAISVLFTNMPQCPPAPDDLG